MALFTLHSNSSRFTIIEKINFKLEGRNNCFCPCKALKNWWFAIPWHEQLSEGHNSQTPAEFTCSCGKFPTHWPLLCLRTLSYKEASRLRHTYLGSTQKCSRVISPGSTPNQLEMGIHWEMSQPPYSFRSDNSKVWSTQWDWAQIVHISNPLINVPFIDLFFLSVSLFSISYISFLVLSSK